MIGGTVIELTVVKQTLKITVISDVHKDIYVLTTPLTSAAKCIEEDDAVFSNGESIYWTPRMRCFHDLKMELVGKPVLKPKKEEPVKAFSEKNND